MLPAGRSGDRIPAGENYFVSVQTGLGLFTNPPVHWVPAFFSGGKATRARPLIPIAEVEDWSYTSPPSIGLHGLI
jgi:hypothetical protein